MHFSVENPRISSRNPFLLRGLCIWKEREKKQKRRKKKKERRMSVKKLNSNVSAIY
jgi:hypothetical protein